MTMNLMKEQKERVAQRKVAMARRPPPKQYKHQVRDMEYPYEPHISQFYAEPVQEMPLEEKLAARREAELK